MELIRQVPELSAYLAADDVIDHGHPVVREAAARLRAGTSGAHEYARAAFGFVRDAIPHSYDTNDPRVTWRASDVIEQRTGICHAKAHALVALLRAGSVPAALCYQKLDVVHGLVAVRMPGGRTWHRQDPRGNKPGVDARFSLGAERLGVQPHPKSNEMDSPVLYAEPHPKVLRALRSARDRLSLRENLPASL
ncbi:transglutaminase-like domain-containing protein [Streptomyces wuyuanensis]|uniref:transglutaminase-like domain-containing protein n=1 Tax=Streptomyces wuyuanensis TaxID=1196353 RepID=UPI003417D0A0